MADERRLRIGVIGLGWQGGSHLANLAANPEVELVAGCDLDPDRLKAAVEKYRLRHTFTDYLELLGCDEVEAVVIVLPDFLHREAATAALEAGKHVLLEKPMALTVADAEAMAKVADAAPGCFMLNLSNRFMYPFSKGKETIDSGAVGQVRYVFSRMSNRIEVPTEKLPWLQQSHLAHWIGVHRLDLARWWIGKDVVRVRAVERSGVLKSRGFDAPDFYQATLEFDGGAVMSLEGSWILPPSWPSLVDSRFYALCDNGVIDVDRTRSELMVSGEGFELSTPTAGATLGVQSGFTYAATQHFVSCCLSGQAPIVGAADGVALTKALCALVESARSDGQVVEIE